MTRGGYVLLLTVGMLFVCSAIALGMLAASSKESMIALQVERHARLASVAESAVRTRLAAWSTLEEVATPVGSTRPVENSPHFIETFLRGDDRVTVGVRRLSATLFQVEAEAALDHLALGPQMLRAAALVRVIDPMVTRASFGAAATTDSAVISRGTLTRTIACSPEDHGPTLLARVPPVLGPEAVLVGSRPTEVGDTDPALAELLLVDAARSVADLVIESGAHRPRPAAAASTCVPGPKNWGSPDAAHACHELRPLVHITGPATVDGGAGRAAIVVNGDLELAGDAHLRGILVVSGTLVVRDAAVVRGAVLARRLEMLGGRLEYDGCEVEAVASAPALDRAFRPVAGSWIPVW